MLVQATVQLHSCNRQYCSTLACGTERYSTNCNGTVCTAYRYSYYCTMLQWYGGVKAGETAVCRAAVRWVGVAAVRKLKRAFGSRNKRRSIRRLGPRAWLRNCGYRWVDVLAPCFSVSNFSTTNVRSLRTGNTWILFFIPSTR